MYLMILWSRNGREMVAIWSRYGRDMVALRDQLNGFHFSDVHFSESLKWKFHFSEFISESFLGRAATISLNINATKKWIPYLHYSFQLNTVFTEVRPFQWILKWNFHFSESLKWTVHFSDLTEMNFPFQWVHFSEFCNGFLVALRPLVRP